MKKLGKMILVTMIASVMLTTGTVTVGASHWRSGAEVQANTAVSDETFVCPRGNAACTDNGSCLYGCGQSGYCYSGSGGSSMGRHHGQMRHSRNWR